ncbi:hypothetical protein D9M70_640950 [compost metagenome]
MIHRSHGELFLAFGHVAAVVARLADVVAHLLFERLGEVLAGADLQRFDQAGRDAVAAEIEETRFAGGPVQFVDGALAD